MQTIILVLIGYLVGSIPFGLLVGKLWAGKDVREYGSGNIGVSNVLRTVGIAPAVLVLLFDAGKGVVPVILGRTYGGETLALLAGIGAIAGHNWSVFLRFRGGKGIATSLGVVTAFAPWWSLGLVAIWFLLVGTTRYISLGSIVASLALPVLAVLAGKSWIIILGTVVMATFAVYRHKANIGRLARGEELKIGQKVGNKR